MTATKQQPIAGYRISDPSDPTIKPWLSETPDDNGYTSEPLYAGAAPAAVAGPVDERVPDEVLAAIRHAGLQLIRIGGGFRVEKAQQFTAAAAPALEAPAAPGVPAGFALVPIEPTQQMLDAGRWSGAGSVSIQEEWARKEVWSRMLATVTPPPAAYADDLVALVTELVQALRQAAPDNDLAGHALDYLRRNGLQGSPLRAAEAAPQAPAAPVAGNWVAASDVDRLVRELDVALHGGSDAAPQASLCDIVGLAKAAAGKLGRPVLAATAAPAVDAARPKEPLCTECGADLKRVVQCANSYLSAEQFDADKLGDWFCECCPKGPSQGSRKHRYFWNAAIAAQAKEGGEA